MPVGLQTAVLAAASSSVQRSHVLNEVIGGWTVSGSAVMFSGQPTHHRQRQQWRAMSGHTRATTIAG